MNKERCEKLLQTMKVIASETYIGYMPMLLLYVQHKRVIQQNFPSLASEMNMLYKKGIQKQCELLAQCDLYKENEQIVYDIFNSIFVPLEPFGFYPVQVSKVV